MTVEKRLDNLDAKFESLRQDMAQGFSLVAEVLVAVRETFQAMSKRFDKQDVKIEEIQDTLESIDNKLDGVMEVVKKIQGDVYNLNAR